jgi:hypothetical protein
MFPGLPGPRATPSWIRLAQIQNSIGNPDNAEIGVSLRLDVHVPSGERDLVPGTLAPGP